MNKKRILITGSSGMLGTRLSQRLLQLGYQINLIDKKPNSWDRQLNKLTQILDLRYLKSHKALPKSIDLVIHLAANSRVYKLTKRPFLAMNNVSSLITILEYCRLNGVKKIIFPSSREVYGNQSLNIFREEDILLKQCGNVYAASKLSAEAFISSYSNNYGLNYVIHRLSNVYGMYDTSDRIIPTFINNALRNSNLTIYGSKKKLDFIYIDDVVNAFVLTIEKLNLIADQVFNIGSGVTIDLHNLAQMIIEMTKSKSKIITEEYRDGETNFYNSNIDRLSKTIGLKEKTSLALGLQRAISWYKILYNT